MIFLLLPWSGIAEPPFPWWSLWSWMARLGRYGVYIVLSCMLLAVASLALSGSFALLFGEHLR